MSTLTDQELWVLNELRERSDGNHEQEFVSGEEVSPNVLIDMARKDLVVLQSPMAQTWAWITDTGRSALLAHEVGTDG